MKSFDYPFSILVGQTKLVRALLVLSVSDKINSLLIAGGKGTGKTMAARSIKNISDMDIVNLPLNITEDNLFGGLDIKKTLESGKIEFQQGILAEAENKILYIDEINLFPNEYVNTILDAIETGFLQIERDGYSDKKIIRSKLIGTMNPEEGFLNNSITDKFSIYAETDSNLNKEERLKILKKNLSLDKENKILIEELKKEDKILSNKILSAKKRLKNIKVSDSIITRAEALSKEANCLGYRASIYLIHTAQALAAIDSNQYITDTNLQEAAELVLKHRKNTISEKQNKNQIKQNKDNNDKKHSDKNKSKAQSERRDNINIDSESEISNNKNDYDIDKDNTANNQNTMKPKNPNTELADKIFKIKNLLNLNEDNAFRKGLGKRNKTRTNELRGKSFGYTRSNHNLHNLALIPTIKSAASHQIKPKEGIIKINKDDYKFKRRKTRIGTSIIFLVDASGSMGAMKRMKETKNAILSLLMDSYQKHDEVSMITFAGIGAEIALPFTRSVLLAKRELQLIPTIGKTPLSIGLNKALEYFKIHRLKNKDMIPLLFLITDGRANHGSVFFDEPIKDALFISKKIKYENIHSVVIDTESGFVKLAIAEEIAKNLNAKYYQIENLKPEIITAIVHQNTEYSLSRIDIMEDKR
ncbi:MULTISPECIES: magnesium chelatase subunit D family protein [unclassified Treponema]|uniref:magnesium chelatase subunit D family protein n=1 Tax=unclassified Treponema TaxID=2638727 RepID=UPI0020A2D385|nr:MULTISPECIES: magnesium chelatase subunit D family protein [unclassified Treponema]UTC67221.1 magnesium chelatase subunit D family protein [Treponema sp. OMZ 789]UTC69950.1 magnesium chelatase subunit D family protein [Treponema sp. OMZ 790]UTC72664.1 magnesium chelatase subunit D family protein [Treponema sp. OMZ 791]